MLLQFFWLGVTQLDIGLNSVFVLQFWVSLVSLAKLELTMHQESWHPELLHSDWIPHQSKLGPDEHGLDASGIDTLQDLKTGNVVLPSDFEYGAANGRQSWTVDPQSLRQRRCSDLLLYHCKKEVV